MSADPPGRWSFHSHQQPDEDSDSQWTYVKNHSHYGCLLKMYTLENNNHLNNVFGKKLEINRLIMPTIQTYWIDYDHCIRWNPETHPQDWMRYAVLQPSLSWVCFQNLFKKLVQDIYIYWRKDLPLSSSDWKRT